MDKLLQMLLIAWCVFCGGVELSAAISVWKRVGALPGAITAFIMATPWLLLI